MAKQGKVLPARRQRDGDEPSVLLRSAESLGRVIGLLQRQLDTASTRISGKTNGAASRAGVDGNDGHRRTPASRSAKGSVADGVGRVPNRANGSPATKRKSKRAAHSAAKKTAAKARTSKK
jgi:hypothetical protein